MTSQPLPVCWVRWVRHLKPYPFVGYGVLLFKSTQVGGYPLPNTPFLVDFLAADLPKRLPVYNILLDHVSSFFPSRDTSHQPHATATRYMPVQPMPTKSLGVLTWPKASRKKGAYSQEPA